jgi:antitoxin (DNA-binding transcriptional repressor) of toxin-antitoxin stability system
MTEGSGPSLEVADAHPLSDERAGAGRQQRGWGPWSDAGGCRACLPGLALGGPSGWCSCWDPFWPGSVAAAANPVSRVAVPPQSIPATAIAGRLPHPAQRCVHIWREDGVATRIGIRELRARLASHLESSTPIEVTRHGRTIGLYVPLPQQGNLSDRDKVLEAGRLMQAELVRLGLSEDELSADFKAWRKGRPEQPSA